MNRGKLTTHRNVRYAKIPSFVGSQKLKYDADGQWLKRDNISLYNINVGKLKLISFDKVNKFTVLNGNEFVQFRVFPSFLSNFTRIFGRTAKYRMRFFVRDLALVLETRRACDSLSLIDSWNLSRHVDAYPR